ncbi:MAG: hypothetical protein COZ31_11750 [Nitrospirae bacterium CG_4_10_14_3_um_filter_44_29]|nr:hypothetical protein [Nitrospirota bacterium]OIO28630.1 MAG: hypothetical protein AUJ60_07055 [Nitrospirae bacterium CG1_02_44_142]PIV43595.1 MAG: hypothetical protein COS28_01940 [Nitrospirae bacterium CG02_land_8_20_14_3_00_44_33]PIV65584.1 MAG: hypothetical protein COS10_10625 [Nitrospirae bacterium CG01_land_8_20_14_3_00_44_22]PIX87180.1 MAG: hypothetical protein COZ31_11750 [Nitrospirae bacterium CG_4_10_14_3_um_filter_44_29]PJA82034.1 MAG: hypothetical protein CO147_06810 [Nitrospirae
MFNISFLNTKKLLLIISGGVIPLGFLFYSTVFLGTTSCVPAAAPQVQYYPIPQYGNLYSFPRYNIPEAKKPGSINLTTVIIVPEYKDTATQEYVGGAKVASGGPMTADMRKVFQSFAGSMGEDIQSQLVAKGMTTKGPFSMSEVTYPDKKGADLTISIGVIFDIQYSDPKAIGQKYFEGGVYGNVYSSTMTVGMKIYFYMLEPLSEEKMWIKKLDLGVQDFPIEYAVGREQYVTGSHYVPSDGCGGGGYSRNTYGWRDKGILYTERAKVFSDILKTAYPQIMKAAWNYLNTDEMLNLKLKSQEIRERKRY